MKTMQTWQGTPASSGIAIGPAYVYQGRTLVIPTRLNCDPDEEWRRLQDALAEAYQQIASLQARAEASASHQEAQIFAAHLLMLDDPVVLNQVQTELKASGRNAEAVWHATTQDYISQLNAIDDEYLRARAVDLSDVSQRVLTLLLGYPGDGIHLTQPAILVAADLTPSDTMALDRQLLLGFCTAHGGPTSHTSILARALGLPAVVGASEAVLTIRSGDMVVLDGTAGRLIVNPDDACLSAYRRRQESDLAERQQAATYAQAPACTFDGHRVEVVANIGAVADASDAIAQGAEGVGLLRTEFLFLDRATPPGEEEQYQAYRAIADVMGRRPLVVRTLDIGGDKPAAYLDMRPESNPFLGRRAIRLMLDQPDFFKTQVRAIARAGHERNVKVMFPMVATLSEVRRLRQLVAEVQTELRRANIPQADQLDLGIMVEIPAAALMADILAPEVDFFSIGTNDLTQYTMAADRTNQDVAALADALHPAVLRLIKLTVDGAHRAGKWVGLCGELAGDPCAAPILLGLGVDEFSMAPSLIPTLKATIRALSLAEAQEAAQHALASPDADAVRALITR